MARPRIVLDCIRSPSLFRRPARTAHRDGRTCRGSQSMVQSPTVTLLRRGAEVQPQTSHRSSARPNGRGKGVLDARRGSARWYEHLVETAHTRERAVLVAIEHGHGALLSADESIAELARLSETAGLEVVERVVQAVKRLHPGTLIGAGKVDEVRALAQASGAT